MTKVAAVGHNISKEFQIFQKEGTFIKLFHQIYNNRSFYKKSLILSKISFEINKGEKVALVGRNGAGKTTLLRLIAGILSPSSGMLNVMESPSAFFRFWIGNTRGISVFQTIKLLAAIYRIQSDELKVSMDKIIEMAELANLINQPVKVLSSGQYQRLVLSVFFHVKSDFVIFDEGITYIDSHFFHKCEKYFENLLQSSKTAILTSHDNSFLRKYCNSAIWLDKGAIRMQGPIDEVLLAYERESSLVY